MHAVRHKAMVHALHIFINGTHFGGTYEFVRKAQPRVLIALAAVLHKLYWILTHLLSIYLVRFLRGTAFRVVFRAFVVAHRPVIQEKLKLGV